MRKQLTKVVLSASLALAMAFTLSCSDDGDNDPPSPSTPATGGVPVRAIATALTAGSCTTRTTTQITAATLRTTCFLFVACRTSAKHWR